MSKRIVALGAVVACAVWLVPAKTQAELIFRARASRFDGSTILTDVGPTLTPESSSAVLMTGATPNGASALNFNGIDTAFDLGSPLLAGDLTFTILAFIRPTNIGGSQPNTLMAGGRQSPDFRLAPTPNGAGETEPANCMQFLSAQTVNLGHSSESVTNTAFSSVSVTVNDDVFVPKSTFHINGVMVGDDGSTGLVALTTGMTRLGGAADPDTEVGSIELYNGAIAEIRVYDTALSDAERQAVEAEFQAAYVTSTTAIPGDYNRDGFVDAADYTVWADNFGATGSGTPGDGNADGVVDAADYTIWADHFGQGTPPGLAGIVPEPTGALVMVAPALLILRRRRV